MHSWSPILFVCARALKYSLEQCPPQELNSQISFVYDLCDMSRKLQSLNFVKNAAQRPLKNLEDDEFIATYGIQKQLEFRAATARLPSKHYFWCVFYG